MSLVQYVPTDTFIHRLDPRTKLALIPFVLVLSLVLEHPLYLLIALVVIMGAWIYIRAPLAYVKRLLTMLAIFMVMIVLIQGLFFHQRTASYGVAEADRQVLVDLVPAFLRVGGIERALGSADAPDRSLVLYRVGVIFGVTLGLRLACIVSIMPLVTMTTSLTDLMLALAKLRIPWTYAYLFVTSFRFVPLLMSQTDTILSAQKLRGLAVEKANLFRRITAYAPLAVPVILGAFRNSEQLEAVLACRGFVNVKERTTLYEIGWEPRDSIAIAVMILLILTAVTLRITGIASLPS